ncbi:major facilitator superfamily domain-containing protein [Aspergillus germanicus]
MGVQILQQAQGVSFIQNFIVTFMQQLGFPDPLRSNLIMTGCSFAVHIITFLTFDKIGRRPSLLIGALLMAGTMLGTGGATTTGTAGDYSDTAAQASVALVILWYCIYGFTWGPGCWVLAGEVGTGQLRERTLFLASMGSFVTSVPINFVNPYVQADLGGGVTFIYGAFSVVAAVWAKVKTREFRRYLCTGLGAEITNLDGCGMNKEGAEVEWVEKEKRAAALDLATQQFLGLTLFSTFASYFFQQAGLQNPFLVKCIIIGINIGTNLAVILLADRIGRRRISCTWSTLSWFACVAVGILGVTPSAAASNYLFILFAILWNMGVVCNRATGWGFIGEISSQRLRGYTAGLGAATTCVAGVVMNVLTPYMLNKNQWNWGLRAGWLYADIGLPCVVLMWLLIPETNGRSSEELDELFERRIKPWRFRNTETATQRVLNLN